MSKGSLAVSQTNEVTVVSFRSTTVLDISTSQSLAKEMLRLASGPPAPRIVVDFSEVRFIASRMLGILVELTKKAQAAHGQVVVCGLQGDVNRVFRVMRLDKLLTIAESPKAAIDLLDPAGEA